MNALVIATIAVFTILFVLAFAYALVGLVVAHVMTRAKQIDPNRNPLWDRYNDNRITFQRLRRLR